MKNRFASQLRFERRKLSLFDMVSLITAILIPVIFLILTLDVLKSRSASLSAGTQEPTRRSDRKENAVSSPTTKKGTPPTATRKTDETVKILAKTDFVYPTDRTRNPFSRAPADVIEQSDKGYKPTSPLPVLTGIIWDEKNPIAILMDNNRRSYTARKNGQVMSLKVIEIYPRSVLIEKDGLEYELKLWDKDKGLSDFSLE